MGRRASNVRNLKACLRRITRLGLFLLYTFSLVPVKSVRGNIPHEAQATLLEAVLAYYTSPPPSAGSLIWC